MIVGPTPKIGAPLDVAAAVKDGIPILIDVNVCVVVGTINAGPPVVLVDPMVIVGALEVRPVLVKVLAVPEVVGNATVELLAGKLELTTAESPVELFWKVGEATVESRVPVHQI